MTSTLDKINKEVDELFGDDEEVKDNVDVNVKETKSQKGFKEIVIDFYNDLVQTFPEIKNNVDKDMENVVNNNDESGESLERVKEYCKKVMPERFFDILYQNEKILLNEEEGEGEEKGDKEKVNTCFLPGIDFSELWKENISDNTRKIIWKYLQLLLFTVVTEMSDGGMFGETAKLFETINNNDFKKKLEESITQMQDVFINMNKENNDEGGLGGDKTSLPDPEEIHKHISGMLNGKIGKLAKEIADKVSKNFKLDLNNEESVQDVFQTLIKNPKKMMELVNTVGSELDKKFKSGDIKENDLMDEANEIVKNMKNIPGMNNFKEMFSKMGIDPEKFDMSQMSNIMKMMGGVKGGKVNMGATKNRIDNLSRLEKRKDILREKLKQQKEKIEMKKMEELMKNSEEYKKKQLEEEEKSRKALLELNLDEKNKIVFSSGEKYEKTIINKNNKKNKKNKK